MTKLSKKLTGYSILGASCPIQVNIKFLLKSVIS